MTTETPSLHLFSVCENEQVSAENAAEALGLWLVATGHKSVAEFDDSLTDDDAVEQLPDGRIVKAWVTSDGQIGEHGEGTLTALTAAEWAKRYGKGIVFSSEA